MAEEAKKGISASFQQSTIDAVTQLAAEEKRSFSLMCELLVLEGIHAREKNGSSNIPQPTITRVKP